MRTLQRKKVLFFAPRFFNYENEIKEEIERQGGIVHFYDERNNPTSIQKILLRKCRFILSSWIDKYYKHVCSVEKNFNPDFVFFISPETVTKKSITLLKNAFPNSKFILYMWDSIENKNSKNVYKCFDICFSFDLLDCKKYNFKFRPLFFLSEYEKVGLLTQVEYTYDFSFIGTIHSDRAKILNILRKQFEEQNISFFYYLFIPGKLMLFIRKIFDKNVRELAEKYVHITGISKEEVNKVFSITNYSIDINHPKQVGLTMRTIEMLGMKKKLLTTNTNIKNYDFYDDQNFIVIDRKKIELPNLRQKNAYKPINAEIYNNYKISNWVKVIFQ